MNEELRKWLISIFEEGENSLFVNNLFSQMVIFGKQYLKIKVNPLNRQKLYNEIGLIGSDEKCIDDLAIDLIADLFVLRENKFYEIEKFLLKGNCNVYDSPIELLISKIRSLVFSSAKDRIFDIKNPLYAKIRKSLNICLTRTNKYTEEIINDNKYIYTCSKTEIDFTKSQIDPDTISEKLLEKHLEDPFNTELMDLAFEIVNNQNNFNKAVLYKLIVQAIYDYHKRRFILEFGSETSFELINIEGDEYEHKEIGEEFKDTVVGKENFTKILTEYLEENKKLKTITFQNVMFYYLCLKKLLNFKLNEFPVNQMILELFKFNQKDHSLNNILILIFNILNSQNLYIKAYKFNNLAKILYGFYSSFKSV